MSKHALHAMKIHQKSQTHSASFPNIHMKIELFTVDVDVLWYPPVAHTSSHLIHLPVVEDPEPYEYRDILI